MEKTHSNRGIEATVQEIFVDIRKVMGIRGAQRILPMASSRAERAPSPTEAASFLELADLLSLSRPECVPNLTRRFKTRLSVDPSLREHYEALEEALDGNNSVPVPKTTK
jgi:hypothetical protein